MKEDNSKVILVIVVGFLVLSYIFTSAETTLRYIAVGIGITSFIPPLERLIVWIWDKIAFVLGWINTKIILSLVFFIFLTPFGILSRLFSKSNLKLKHDDDTTFVERNHTYTKKDMENIW